MYRYFFILASVLVLFLPWAVFAHEGGTETITKVTVESLSGEQSATEATAPAVISDAEKDAAIAKDVAVIEQDVADASGLFVVKAVAVLVGVAALAFTYLRRPKKEKLA